MGILVVMGMNSDGEGDDQNQRLCLMSNTTINRKRTEARELAARKEEDVRKARKEARIKQRKEEQMDRKST